MRLRGVWLILLLALAGCTTQISRNTVTDEPVSPEGVIIEAKSLRDRGDWLAAIDILKRARDRYPQSAQLAQALEQLDTAWKYEKRSLEDQVLVLDSKGLIQKQALLERLQSLGGPDYLLKSRLLFWRQFMNTKYADLLACAHFHQQRNLWLSRRCLELAYQIRPSEQLQQELAAVQAKIDNWKDRAERKRRKKGKQESRKRTEQLLEQAKGVMAHGDHGRAIRLLQQADRLNPGNRKIQELMGRAQSELDRQAAALLRLGDRLYREERIDSAVAIWEAAFKLTPGNEEIRGKIDRARRVLDKLQRLKQGIDATDGASG